MAIGVWILGNQLWQDQAALASCGSQAAPVLFIESTQFAQERPYHRQKLVLVWSAMRHFAAELKDAGWAVTYSIGDDTEAALRAWLKAEGITELRVMDPVDHPFTTW
ncbi:MAG TPA: cryptochrome/photolyase family protein, partial [Nodosilinea sp.]|nr:cryptochrome/photolyase family protein [Nodosilinea sp.]